MKNSYKALLLAALGLSAMAAQATTTDLLLGFNDDAAGSSSANDYVIDLGAYSLFTQTASLSSANSQIAGINLSTFATAYSSDANAANDVAAGVVGAYTGTYPHSLFATFATPGGAPSSTHFNNAANNAQGIAIGEYATAASGSDWSYIVAPDAGTTVGAYGSGVGVSIGNPLQTLVNGEITENLYESTKSSSTVSGTAWAEVGTFDINANTGVVTFEGVDAVSVPEPTTYGLIAGAGLLVVSLRRQFVKKNA